MDKYIQHYSMGYVKVEYFLDALNIIVIVRGVRALPVDFNIFALFLPVLQLVFKVFALFLARNLVRDVREMIALGLTSEEYCKYKDEIGSRGIPVPKNHATPNNSKSILVIRQVNEEWFIFLKLIQFVLAVKKELFERKRVKILHGIQAKNMELKLKKSFDNFSKSGEGLSMLMKEYIAWKAILGERTRWQQVELERERSRQLYYPVLTSFDALSSRELESIDSKYTEIGLKIVSTEKLSAQAMSVPLIEKDGRKYFATDVPQYYEINATFNYALDRNLEDENCLAMDALDKRGREMIKDEMLFCQLYNIDTTRRAGI